MHQRYYIRRSASDSHALQLCPALEDGHIIVRGILLQYHDMHTVLAFRVYPDQRGNADSAHIICRVYVNGYKAAQASMTYDFLPTYIERVIKDRAIFANYVTSGISPARK